MSLMVGSVSLKSSHCSAESCQTGSMNLSEEHSLKHRKHWHSIQSHYSRHSLWRSVVFTSDGSLIGMSTQLRRIVYRFLYSRTNTTLTKSITLFSSNPLIGLRKYSSTNGWIKV